MDIFKHSTKYNEKTIKYKILPIWLQSPQELNTSTTNQ